MTPPTITVVSPGTIRPTNAPVSRKVSTPTSAYVHPPSAVATSSITVSKSGSSPSTPLA
jgi:hypothetical protein